MNAAAVAQINAGLTYEATSELFGNEFGVADSAQKIRWVCIAPYGDWPNSQGLQRFKPEDARCLINEFNSLLNTPQRILGLPWYIGHPDHPAFNERYKDTKAYGRIKKLEARQDGLYAGVRFNRDGEQLIADESFHGHSVNWYLKRDELDSKAWRPFRIKSVGFTNEPNIPVSPVTTANEKESMNLRAIHLAKIRAFGYRTFANAEACKTAIEKAQAEVARKAAVKPITPTFKKLANSRLMNSKKAC